MNDQNKNIPQNNPNNILSGIDFDRFSKLLPKFDRSGFDSFRMTGSSVVNTEVRVPSQEMPALSADSIDADTSETTKSPKDATSDLIGDIAGTFVDDSAKIFEKEHSGRQKPVASNPGKFPEKLNTTSTTRSSDMEDIPKKVSARTIDQQIDSQKIHNEYEKKSERHPKKDLRVRHNFGTDFHISSKYTLKPSNYDYLSVGVSEEEYKPVFNNLTNNRKLLYGYLQHLGMCLVDDTGRDPTYGDEMDGGSRGFLMLPAEIEHSDFFEFEDVIRQLFPFTKHELRLKLLEAKRDDPSTKLDAVDYVATPEQIRDVVDTLALDKKFMHLFEKAEKIQAARKQKPREIIEEVQPDDTEEIPTFDPQTNKQSKWR